MVLIGNKGPAPVSGGPSHQAPLNVIGMLGSVQLDNTPGGSVPLGGVPVGNTP